MQSIKYALKNINVINIILACIVAMSLAYAILPLKFKSAVYTPAPVKELPSPAVDTGLKHTDAKPPSPQDYAVIAEQNLFHPDRKIPVPLPPPPPPLPKPDFVLYGTLMTDGEFIAYMEDRKAPKTTQGRGKRQTHVRLGDSLSGFAMKEIDVDKVVMVRGDETMTVYLSDKTKGREGAASAAPAATAQRPGAAAPSPPAQQHTAVEQPKTPPAAAASPVTEKPPTTPPARKKRGIFGLGN